MRPPARSQARARFFAVLAGGIGIAALCGAWAAARGPEVPSPAPVSLQARPVPLDEGDPARERIGALVSLGGVELQGDFPGFGGYSGLRLLPDGRLLAVSDRGHWLAFRPVEQGQRLTGVAQAVHGPLLDEAGQPLGYPDYDAEALEVLPGPEGTLDILVAFEQRHRLWRYAVPMPAPILMGGQDVGETPQQAEGRPEGLFSQRPVSLAPLLKDWGLDGWPGPLPANAGLEAVAVSATGAALLLAEGTGRGRLRLRADAPWVPIRYNSAPGFKPTDAAFLPVPGRHLALVLSRHFSILHGVAATLELVDLEAAKDGVLPGRLLARLAPPVSVDNMEGVAVAPHPAGGWSVYLMADDNQNPLQRTLLLKFHLPAGAVAP